MNGPGRGSGLEPLARTASGHAQIHLAGFMGCGKSTVARLLARRLVWNYLDLDILIARHAGASIAAIFAADGEASFRDMESHVLRQAVQKPCTVVALGGGTMVFEENRRVIGKHAMSVCYGPASRPARSAWGRRTVARYSAIRRQRGGCSKNGSRTTGRRQSPSTAKMPKRMSRGESKQRPAAAGDDRSTRNPRRFRFCLTGRQARAASTPWRILRRAWRACRYRSRDPWAPRRSVDTG